MKTRVGVIFGGRSGEHEISIRSAKTVIERMALKSLSDKQAYPTAEPVFKYSV